MNLNAIVSLAIAAVNPMQPVSIQTSAGNTTNSDGSRTPSYNAAVNAFAQVQELTQSDLQHLDALNIQGANRGIYVNGILQGTVRWSQTGGDLLTLDDGTVWLTTAVLEQWPDWVKVSATLQNGS